MSNLSIPLPAAVLALVGTTVPLERRTRTLAIAGVEREVTGFRIADPMSALALQSAAPCVRVLLPGSVIARDCRMDRVNFKIDENGKVVSAHWG